VNLPGGLRFRLAVRASLLTAAALAGVAIVVELTVVRPLTDRADDDLLSRVESLTAVVAEGGLEGFRRQAPGLARAPRTQWAALVGEGGRILSFAGRVPPPEAVRLAPDVPITLSDPSSGDWRVVVRTVAAREKRGTFTLVAGVSLDETRVAQQSVRLIVGFSALAGVLLVGAGAWFGAGLVLDPLGALLGTARRMAEGEEDLRLPVREGGDEIDDLARLLNDLVERVGAALKEERRFAGEAAHELRSPLAILRLRAEDALATGEGEEMRRALEGTLADVDRVNRLVQALLELARAVPSGGSAPPEPLDPGPVLEGMREDFETLGASRGLRFRMEPVPEGPRVAAPREVLETTVSVLVDNAFRYTPGGKEVVLEASAKGGAFRVVVRDDGPGVPSAEADRVFDRLYRGITGRESGGGLGLGLALARRLAASVGGEVVLENPGEPGARFAVVLPLSG